MTLLEAARAYQAAWRRAKRSKSALDRAKLMEAEVGLLRVAQELPKERKLMGNCGHFRQKFGGRDLPCATPKCSQGTHAATLVIAVLPTREGNPIQDLEFVRIVQVAGDTRTYLWREMR